MAGSVLAVDLGKTGCRAALWVGETRTGAEGAGAPGLATVGGAVAAEAAILAVARPLLRNAGMARAGHVSVGAAGALAAPEAAAVLARRLAGALSAESVAVTSDAVAAHAGAFGGGPGVTLAIGTGSVALALGHKAAGRADGWGPLLGDEGGGGWIGTRGMRAALRAAEGRGPETALLAAAQRMFGTRERWPAVVDGAATAARFAPCVARAAGSGDEVAGAILRKAAGHLAATARSAASALPPGAACAVVGGLARLGPELMKPLEALLAEAGLQVVAARGTALDGARLLAASVISQNGLPPQASSDASSTTHEAHVVRFRGGAAADGLDRLATEAVRDGLDDLDQRPPGAVARLAVQAEIEARQALARAVPQIEAAAEAVAARMRAGGRLFYLGAGTPGRLAVLDAAELKPTYSAPDGLVIPLMAGGEAALLRAVEGAEDDAAAAGALLDRYGLRAGDAVVGIAASGRTPFVVGGLRHARACGALTVAVVNNAGSPAAEAAALAIEVLTGPEPVEGSTRMLAGTSQKIVLNALSTSAMVALGKTYGNRMVDVQATNGKLRRRAVRMVQEIAGAGQEEAASALAAVGGRVKPALVMLLAGVDAKEAGRRLEQAGGRVREALR